MLSLFYSLGFMSLLLGWILSSPCDPHTCSFLYSSFFPLCPDRFGLLSPPELTPFKYSLECFLYCHQPFLLQVYHSALISAVLMGFL